jgi:hypothetical protein
LAVVLVRIRLTVGLVSLCRSLVIGSLGLVCGVLKLAYSLAYPFKQLRYALGAEEQNQHENDEDDGLRIAEKQEGEKKHGRAGASEKTTSDLQKPVYGKTAGLDCDKGTSEVGFAY